METRNWNLSTLARLVKFYRWYYVSIIAAVIIYAILIAFNSSANSKFAHALPPYGTVLVWAILILFFLILIVISAPVYFISKNLELLLKKYFSNGNLNVSGQPEWKRIKIYLTAQFILNIFLSFLPGTGTSELDLEKQLSEVTDPILISIYKAILNPDGIWYWGVWITNWLFISFDGIMPIVYFAFGLFLIHLDETNKKLKNELSEVV